MKAFRPITLVTRSSTQAVRSVCPQTEKIRRAPDPASYCPPQGKKTPEKLSMKQSQATSETLSLDQILTTMFPERRGMFHRVRPRQRIRIFAAA